MKGSQQVALCLGQFDAGAVATPETGFAHLHLLAFQAGRDAAHKDDGLSRSYLCEQFLGGRIDFLLHVEVQGSIARLLHIVNLDAIGLTSLYL